MDEGDTVAQWEEHSRNPQKDQARRTDLEKPLGLLESQLPLLRSVEGNVDPTLSFVLTRRDDLCKAISVSTDIW